MMGGAGGAGGFDMASLMQNPALMGMAQEFMKDPNASEALKSLKK